MDLTIIDQKEAIQTIIDIQDIETLKTLVNLQKKRTAQENYRRMFEEYQTAIIRSEQLRAELNQDIESGEPPELLFLKAIDIISLITGDRAIKAHAERKIKGVK